MNTLRSSWGWPSRRYSSTRFRRWQRGWHQHHAADIAGYRRKPDRTAGQLKRGVPLLLWTGYHALVRGSSDDRAARLHRYATRVAARAGQGLGVIDISDLRPEETTNQRALRHLKRGRVHGALCVR